MSEQIISAEENDEIAFKVREALARRRITRQYLADQAMISLSTLEKALSGHRTFTLASVVRLEGALGVTLRRSMPPNPVMGHPAGVAPEELGSYARPAVAWIEGRYLTVRPSFSNPQSIYAQTKIHAEHYLLSIRDETFSPCILRLATLYGISPRMRFDLAVNIMTVKAALEHEVTVYGGEQWRPFMHVQDAARAFIACLQANNVGVVSGEIFNAGSYGLNHRLSEVAEMISKIIPTVEVEHVENEDRRNYRVSFDKIHTRLGFVCEKTLEQGILETAQLVRKCPSDDFSTEMFNNRAMLRIYAQSAGSEQSSIRLLRTLAAAD